MHATQSKFSIFNGTSAIKALLLIMFASASGLSIKAAYDLNKYFGTFPRWFVPIFIFGIIVLILLCLYFILQAWKIQANSNLLTSKQSAYLWIFVVLSFVCTTSVHGFYPFRSNIRIVLPSLDPVLRFNYMIAATGFIASTVLAGIYLLSQWKLLAVSGLMVVALLLLIPNDNCANQFNYWWINTVGASPLMYVPNLFTAFFVVCGLYGIHPKGVAFLALGICFASLLLGVGHQLGIIW